uniref:FMN hydroxy acid dehydrogenase domain-containing protein n=1 Tax=Globodera rostochiensis TaxID=31243 RepID=A0A914H1R4_GLORO
MVNYLADLVALGDVEKRAMDILPRAARGYYESGADDEQTLRENREAFRNFLIRPFALTDVSLLDTSVSIRFCSTAANPKCRPFSRTFVYPIGIAPTAFHRMAHDEGEIATVKAAGGRVSPGGEHSVVSAVYLQRSDADRANRAEKAGFSALVLTVDAPLFGRRRADERNAFQLPDHLKIANFASHEEQSTTFGADVGSSGLAQYVLSLFDSSLNWGHLRWLIQFTELPVLVKGIVRADDALKALEAGAAGIIVSNHGGRQLDHCVSTIEALPEVVGAVKGKIPVFVDGGFRCGTDVFKALALGADLVFIGRPIIHGLAVGGKDGVKHVLRLIRTELDYAMKLSGCPSIDQIRSAKDLVVRKSHFSAKI